MSEPSPATSSGAGLPAPEPTFKLLPTPLLLARPLPKVGHKIYAIGMNKSWKHPWLDAEVVGKLWNDSLEQFDYIVEYQPRGRDGVPLTRGIKERLVALKEMAYTIPCPYTLPVGFRVVARCLRRRPDGSSTSRWDLIAGIVGERARPLNGNRYLIFFDNGDAQYVEPRQVFMVYQSSNLAWLEVHGDNHDFVKKYVEAFPNWPLVKLKEKSLAHVEWNGIWYIALVLEKDCSMIKVQLQSNERIEWIFRGSDRLRSALNASTEKASRKSDTDLPRDYDGYIQKVNIPANVPQPRMFTRHQCTPDCVIPLVLSAELKRLSPLAIPLFLGWSRKVNASSVTYLTPCGVTLKDYDKLRNYLHKTRSNITLDYFYFGKDVNVLDEFVPVNVALKDDDFSKGMEARPIQLVSSNAHDSKPDFEYITESVVADGIDNPRDIAASQIGCECVDNCRGSCNCWDMVEGETENPSKAKTYENGRLPYYSPNGFHECGNKCACNETCANRVVQGGLKWPLQIFKTQKKGWGVRALHDIPKGTFLCSYPGEIFTEEAIAEQRDDNTYYATLLKDHEVGGVGGGYTVDAKFKGNVGRLFNHSCNPSVQFQKVLVNSDDAQFPTLAFFTACVVKAGWELTIDYSYDIDDSHTENAVYCACEMSECRGRLL